VTPEEALKKFEPWVKLSAVRYGRAGVPHEDLCQIGRLAIVRALPLWDEAKGASLFSWLRVAIRNAMVGAIRQERKGAQGQRDVMGEMFMTMSLDEGIDGEDLTLHEIIGSFEEPNDVFLERFVWDSLDKLSPVERFIVELRVLEGQTLKQTAKQLNKAQLCKITPERVRQIQVEALEKLREKVKKDE
jgi:RNA polymerase sigma factor (sigma-70 family)